MAALSILANAFNFEHPAFEFSLFEWIQNLAIATQGSIFVGCLYFNGPRFTSHFLSPHLSQRSLLNLKWGARFLFVAEFLLPTIYSSTFVLYRSPGMCPKKPRFFNPYIQAGFNLAIKGSFFFTSKYLKGPLQVLHPLAPTVVAVAFITQDVWRAFIKTKSLEEYSVNTFRRYVLAPGRKNIMDRRHAFSSSFLEGEGRGPSFDYPPLASRTMIRLLKLQARGEIPGRVISELVAVDVDDAPPYDAISYVWGSSVAEHSLAIGDETKHYIPITKSAYRVLCGLTPLQGFRYVWIDSICINQKDRSEKDVQIPLMNKIYGNATEVVVSLNTNSPTAETVVSFLNRLYWYYTFKDKEILKAIIKSNGDLQASFTKELPFLEETQNWETWRDLTNNNYWTRVWIIQECVVAKEITILCDGIPLAWDVLVFSTLFLRSSLSVTQNPILRSATFSMDRIALLIAHRAIFIEDGCTSPLVDLIVEFNEFQATEPKDKVNALLGVSRDAKVRTLQPDYKKSLQEVYAEVVIFALKTGSFYSFCVAGLSQRQRDDTASELPSWMPQLLSKSTFKTGDYHQRQYTAGTGLPVEFEISGELDQPSLTLKGICLDTIISASSGPGLQNLTQNFVNAVDIPDILGYGAKLVGRIAEMLHLFELHFPSIEHQYQGADCREAFWQTLTDDFKGKGPPERDDLVPILKNLEEFTALANEQHPHEEDKISLHEVISALSSDLAKSRFWPEGGDSAQAVELLASALYTSIFAVTKGGFMALTPEGTMPGDILVIFQGSPVPHILRPNKENSSSYFLWGEAYVHGVMHGEAMGAEKTWFVLN